ncbi:hypothetical protein GBAR_LOCUS14178 [Geodia barretti]|uniref:Uncharacterized protein n=1 Tax=Geodia barretti TaxID=519541 RepID=A0AA35WPH5_GEOBA|nr:hypothetical protein GBAR_LOCUS14178 [Geodia barretti]
MWYLLFLMSKGGANNRFLELICPSVCAMAFRKSSCSLRAMGCWELSMNNFAVWRLVDIFCIVLQLSQIPMVSFDAAGIPFLQLIQV